MINCKSGFLALLPLIFTLIPAHAEEAKASISADSKTGKAPGLFNMVGGDRPAGAKTEITATKESSFDSEKNVAEFTGRVVVRDVQFTLT